MSAPDHEQRIKNLELLVLFLQAEISTLRNQVKRTVIQEQADEQWFKDFSEAHQTQFRQLLADAPDRDLAVSQIVSDYSARLSSQIDAQK